MSALCSKKRPQAALEKDVVSTWCLGVIDSRFIARMESLLHLYGLPYDPKHPLVCFDERPCFLIGEVMAPLNPQPGQVAKEH